MPSNKWTREELIIAFNLYCKIPFGKIHLLASVHNVAIADKRRFAVVAHVLGAALGDQMEHLVAGLVRIVNDLATMIADPKLLRPGIAEQWAKDLDNYGLAGALAGLVSRSSFAREKMEKWTTSGGEWIGRRDATHPSAQLFAPQTGREPARCDELFAISTLQIE